MLDTLWFWVPQAGLREEALFSENRYEIIWGIRLTTDVCLQRDALGHWSSIISWQSGMSLRFSSLLTLPFQNDTSRCHLKIIHVTIQKDGH